VWCALFGCTGWARKFRFEVFDENGQTKQRQIKKDETVILRFTELRPIQPEEWCLLDLTLRLIAEYGAIGGKTVFKPSDVPNRQNAFHHRDFGLIHICIPQESRCERALDDLKIYVQDSQWRQDITYRYPGNKAYDYSWASLTNFWCVKGRYLTRQDSNRSSFNRVVGREELKHPV